MSDLWAEASADHELEAREASFDRADAEMRPVYSFLFQSRTPRELEHRLAFAGERIERIAAACGLSPGELEDTARRRYALIREALPEGVDPVTPVLQAGQGSGSGPEEGYEHDEGPDYSHGYAEVPQGPPGGPAPQVVTPQAPEIPAPLMGATASRCRCGARLTKKAGRCKACRARPGDCMCRTADVTSGSPPSGPPTSGGTVGGMGTGPILPAGVGGQTSAPDGMSPAGLQAGTQAASAGTGGQGGTGTAGMDLTPAQTTTAARDPVAAQIRAVAASVAASNPYLASSECRRVARRVVGGYLRQADLASGVMSDEPWADSPGAAPSGGGDGSGGGHGMGLGEYGLGKSLINKIPGGGGGAAAGAGEAAGGAAALADVAELAAL